MATQRPIRSMDPYAEQFWEFTKVKELRLQKCLDCGKYRWPPGPTCDQCLSERFDWDLLSGQGKAISWTTFHRGYFQEYPPPHTTLALELDEGPYFISTPDGIPPEELREGMRLQLSWWDGEDRFGEYNLPVFGRG